MILLVITDGNEKSVKKPFTFGKVVWENVISVFINYINTLYPKGG